MLTPAISVLSAVEGLVVLPGLSGHIDHFVMPIAEASCRSLPGATSRLRRRRRFFRTDLHRLVRGADEPGPVSLDRRAERARRVQSRCTRSPFLSRMAWLGFVVLGSVFLTVTGAEALYADMGHFGRKPIALAWVWLVFPSLAHQLSRPRRDGAGRSVDHRQSVLPDGPRSVAAGSDPSRHRRDDHRQPSRHLRRLFADAASHPTRPAAAHARSAKRPTVISARSTCRK